MYYYSNANKVPIQKVKFSTTHVGNVVKLWAYTTKIQPWFYRFLV